MAQPDAFWAELPLGRGVELLTRDRNGVAALSKPAGILSLPNRPGEEPRSLLQAAYRMEGEVYEWQQGGQARRLWLLNRLDSVTSGVILVADSAEAAQAVRAHFKRRQVQKIYRALVFGRPPKSSELWRDRIAVDKRGGRIRTAQGDIPAESHMTVVGAPAQGAGFALSLLQLEPKTGRSHQLRVQCANRGLPIVGDQTYGDFPKNRAFAKATGEKRLFLHSLATQFTYSFNGKDCAFAAEAPLPPEFPTGSRVDS